MRFRKATAVLVMFQIVALAGCASAPKNENRLHALELKLKKQEALVQDLKEQNLILEKRVHSAVRSPSSVAQASDDLGESIDQSVVTSEPPTPLPNSFKVLPSKLPARLTVVPAPVLPKAVMRATAVPPTPLSVSSEKTGEHYLYSKILETYRTKNADDLHRTVELLLKSYPESVFADNAIYLSGLLAFEKNDYAMALKEFDRVLREYPRSNKAVAALFAKASIEKRTGRVREAKRGFLQVRDLYPGSPEAARVSVELKLLESASVKHRET